MPIKDYSQQVQTAFTSLRKGLRPFVEREMKEVYKNHWLDKCEHAGIRPNREGKYTWDVMALLKVITNAIFWRDVFAQEKRRGPRERGVFVALLEWRHKLKGHDDEDVSKQTAQEVIRDIIYALRCVDAKDDVEDSEKLLQSLEPISQTAVQIPSFAQKILHQSEKQAEGQLTIPSSGIIDFWGDGHFDFTDEINKDIWLNSPKVQQKIQPWESLVKQGAIGAQQAMIDRELLEKRGSLPWVPDLVGKEWKNKNAVIIVGSAYAGFIKEYSTRPKTMPLNQYLTASSVQDFQKLFLSYVVRGDSSYYLPLQNLCSDLISARRLCLMDLCRVSLVERGSGVATDRGDTSGEPIVKEDPASFEKYVEHSQAVEWLWRRFAGGQARCVLALGTIAEHGLLRLFAAHRMTITQDEKPFSVTPFAQGEWVNKYAEPNQKLKLWYWLKNETWWTIQGKVNGIDRTWYVLPVYHPAALNRKPEYDIGYKQTKAVLKSMLASINN